MDVLNARPRDRVIVAPGIYDMVSVRMADGEWASTCCT